MPVFPGLAVLQQNRRFSHLNFETGEHQEKPSFEEVRRMILRHARMMIEFTADESTWQSGDGGFAYFSGEDNESINIEER